MADFDDTSFDELDALLSKSLKGAAEPVPSAGVADAIRSRVAAGDTGASVAGSTAPGWAPAARPPWLFPLLGGVVGLAAILAVLIVVLLGQGAPAPAPVPSTTPSTSQTPTETPTPTPSPTPTRTPTPEATTQPKDTTAPRIANYYPDRTTLDDGSNKSALITVLADDDVAVTAVTITWSGPASGTGQMTFGGNDQWTYTFTPPPSSYGNYVLTMVARDAAGNVSSPVSIQIAYPQPIVVF